MAFTAVKVGQIARTTLGMLIRELVIARTVWNDAVDSFDGALNDTVTIRMRARVAARTRTLRAGTPLTGDTLVEFPVPVQLTTDVYQSVPVTDEQMNLDIESFATQVQAPQTEAVALGVEDQIATRITGAAYPAAHTLEFDNTDPWKTINRARRLLNAANVAMNSRTLLVGTQIEEAILNSDRFVKADNIGDVRASTALAEATIGRIGGFQVVATNAIDPDEAYAYHRTAFVLGTRAPRVPEGVTAGASVSYQGTSARWIMDYDYANTTDRSLVNTWVGTAAVTDPDDPTDTGSDRSLIRAVKIADLTS
jgi:hypothetical protein